MSKTTILCVDDEHNVLLTLRNQLIRHFPDCTVELAESGAEALEVVEDIFASGVELPLVIVDQIMPSMRGDELLIELHARHPEILKVMLTGHASVENLGNVVNHGSLYRFISKPWDEMDLKLTVAGALRSYQQDQQLVKQQLDLEQTNLELMGANANLERANTGLMQLAKLKDEFLATISHELRTPLNAILGMAECLQDQVFGEVNPSQEEAISAIESSGRHLLKLINDILDVSKLTSGKMKLDIKPVAIADLCKSSLDNVQQQAMNKQIQITTNISPNIGIIEADEERMRQVLINLLNNAVKFTPMGGKVSLDVEMEEQNFKYWINFSVTDTGISISSTDQEKLFQPFVQIDSGLNRQYEGLGLGLTIVKQIVELHGGNVDLIKPMSQGSRFRVRLPSRCIN